MKTTCEQCGAELPGVVLRDYEVAVCDVDCLDSMATKRYVICRPWADNSPVIILPTQPPPVED